MFQHHYYLSEDLQFHYAEIKPDNAKNGYPVIFCHGFPHCWYSWHRQMRELAENGYWVVAPDMRGMGESSAPDEMAFYGVENINHDLIALLDALGVAKAVFVGLDFGAFAAYDLAMMHPDKVLAVIGLENPAAPHNPEKPPLQEYAEMAKNHFVHIEYFREPGVADKALDAEPETFLKKVYYALSADYHYLDVWQHPPGTSYLDALPEAPDLPWHWLSEDEFTIIADYYKKSGFTGGLNWYRSMDLKWRERKPYEGKTSPVPAYFIGSAQDCDLEGFHGDNPIELMRKQFPNLLQVDMIQNAGHMVQLEKSEEVTALLLHYMENIREIQE